MQQAVVHPKDVQKALIETVKRFPARIEVAAYVVADNEDTLNLAVLPQRIIGVPGRDGEPYAKREMENLTDRFGRTITMLATTGQIHELGIHVVAAREGVPQNKSQFFPLSELILDRPLARYLPDQSIAQLFPGRDFDDISDEELQRRVIRSEGLRTATHMHFTDTAGTITFLTDHPLVVDMFSSATSLHPMNEYLLWALSRNAFRNGRYFGMIHRHCAYSEDEIARDPFLQELKAIDPQFMELMTPLDAVQLVASRNIMSDTSRGKLDTRMIFSGVTVLNPETFEAIGSTYFDVVELSKDLGDFRSFEVIASRANEVTDHAVVRDYFQLVRKYSPSRVPEYVAS